MIFLDLETTVNGGPTKDSPEAHWLNNKVLLAGYSSAKDDAHMAWVEPHIKSVCLRIQNEINNKGEAWVVAHNAKFDLKYLMRDRPDIQWQYVRVWDTMTYEYLQSGHAIKFISLEDACKRRGIPIRKTLDLGAILDSGLKMEDIPTQELTDYLKTDVQMLKELWSAQQQDKYQPDMDYILPLAEMELNGLPVNIKETTHMYNELTDITERHYRAFCATIRRRCTWQDGSHIVADDFNEMLGTKSKTIKPMANRTISFLLYGCPAELKITQKWRVIPKTGTKANRCPYLVGPQVQDLFGKTTSGSKLGFPVSEDDLIKTRKKYKDTTLIIDSALTYRQDSKLLGTYVAPFLTASAVQGSIYPKLNTTTTGTGRLSSSAPNGQNIPPIARALIVADAKGEDLLEVDFSQLEMVGAATLSGDKQMIQDLQNGEDLHYNTGQKVMGWTCPSDMSKTQRTLVKNVNFGVLYGGKANGLSHQTGVGKQLVQELINAFYKRYPRVAEWQWEVFKYVVDNLHVHDIQEGEQRYASEYHILSGRRFSFVEQRSPAWVRKNTGRGYSFSPQQTANYPIQGFAGGDIVMYALVWLWRASHTSRAASNIKFRMTVHDSIVVQVKKGFDMTPLLKAMCAATVTQFSLPVDLHFEQTRGDNWQ